MPNQDAPAAVKAAPLPIVASGDHCRIKPNSGAQHCQLAAAMLAMLNTVPESVDGITYPTHVQHLLTRGWEEAGLKQVRGADGMFTAEAG